MAKKFTQEEVEKAFEQVGAKLITPYRGSKERLTFLCSKCGSKQSTRWSDFNKQSELMKGLCTGCKRNIVNEKQKHSFLKIKNEFESKGAALISTEYINNATPLYFKCSVCGGEASITWRHYISGRNPNLLCMACNNRARPTIEQIKSLVEGAGAVLLTKEYVNDSTKIEFLCSNCGGKHFIKWEGIRQGNNKKFLCPVCMPNFKPSVERVRELFESRGAELLSTTYINNHHPIKFKCSRCGKPWQVSWNNVKNNPRLLCIACYKGELLNPGGGIKYKRLLVDGFWLHISLEFFNLYKEQKDKYSAHHLLQFHKYIEYRTSFCNVYPLRREYHSAGFKLKDVGDPFHKIPEYKNPENLPSFIKLPYHDYSSFRFLDLNSKLITEILIPFGDFTLKQFEGRTNAQNPLALFIKKRKYLREGVRYLPFYFREVVFKRELVFSLIRANLYEYFPDVYKYTGQEANFLILEDLKICEVPLRDARVFQEETHVEGYKEADVFIALKNDTKIVAIMSFKKLVEGYYTLVRFSVSLNTIIPKAEEALFSFFIRKHKPQEVLSFHSIRLGHLDVRKTIEYKLGFIFEGWRAPDFFYVREDTLTLYSKEVFLKRNLQSIKKHLFNMEDSSCDFIRQYDCGTYAFVWRPSSVTSSNF